jgi:hypothetical protein
VLAQRATNETGDGACRDCARFELGAKLGCRFAELHVAQRQHHPQARGKTLVGGNEVIDDDRG